MNLRQFKIFGYGFLLICILGISIMSSYKLADQTKDIFNYRSLPERTNNWMSIQGGGEWEGLAETQIHPRQLKFDTPEYGIRAGTISLISRALRKNNNPTLSINQIFFEDDGWAEDKQSYKMDLISRGIPEDKVYNMLNIEEAEELINFISSHEMGRKTYGEISEDERKKAIIEGINMAYTYVNDPNYKRYNQLVGK